MSKLAVGIASLVVGLVAGGVGGAMLGTGAGAGVGAATGIATGVCSTVQAAQQLGLLTPQQIDQVLDKAAQNVSAKGNLDTSHKSVGSAKECEDYMARFDKTSAK